MRTHSMKRRRTLISACVSAHLRSRPGVGLLSQSGRLLTHTLTSCSFFSGCITSSPLILSLDVRNETAVDLAWPVISNKEAISVNQAW